MMPPFEEWAYELSDESESFSRRAEAIEEKLRAAYEAGRADGKPAVSHSDPEVSTTPAEHPQFTRYTITSEGASLGYFRLVEDSEGAWMTSAEVDAYFRLAGVVPHAPQESTKK